MEHLGVGEEGGLMKTRELTTHPKQPTNLCSPCCGQQSIRYSSPTSTVECSGPESPTIKPTAYLNLDFVGHLTQSYYIKECGCGMRTFKENTNNLKVNYIMT